MKQTIITAAENGFIIEVRVNNTTEVLIAKNMAQVLKLVRDAFAPDARNEDDPPF